MACNEYFGEKTTVPYNYLYRVLRRDEEDCQETGIRAKNPAGDVTVKLFVEHGSYAEKLPPGGSQFIATAASLEAATYFAERSMDYRRNIAVKIACIDTRELIKVKQDPPLRYINLNDIDTREHYFPPDDRRSYNYATRFEEVLVIGRIPADCITNVYSLKLNEETGKNEFIGRKLRDE